MLSDLNLRKESTKYQKRIHQSCRLYGPQDIKQQLKKI